MSSRWSAPYDSPEENAPYAEGIALRHDHDAHSSDAAEHGEGHEGHGGHGSHGWMVLICCIPMLLIAVGLMVAGAASPEILVPAILCTVMMALMMRAMPGGGHGNH